ncbi:hypothetical protein C9I92_21775 [Photobacterium ganghwense]|nr:hypothetical protein C9I92_21775 [Photobacterium ganghwense]
MKGKPDLLLEDFAKLEEYLESTNIFIISALSTSLERAFISIPDNLRIDSCNFLKKSRLEQYQWLLSASQGREEELKRFVLRKFYQLLN